MPSDPAPRIGARDRPLVSVQELAARLADPRLRLVDVRWVLGQPGAGRLAYEAGHIAGAIFLDLDADLADLSGLGAPGRHPLPSPAAFARRLEAAGIGDVDLVVAYDDAGGWIAARLWWMLDDLGFNAPGRPGGVAVLDGGLRAWLAAGLPISTSTPSSSSTSTSTGAGAPSLPRRHLHLADRWTRVIDREAVRARLPELILLDARAGERYRGEVEPIDPVAGHIPTAVSAPWGDSVDGAGRVLAPAALRARYEALGAGESPAGQVVSYCGSGVTACHHALAMRVAGLPDPMIYVGSYSDWSRSGFPVAGGADPGDAPAR